MPDREHDIFQAPDDPDARIWRYMDFTKYVSMLEQRGLFFCRAHRLGDPFEGSWPEAHRVWRSEFQSRFRVDFAVKMGNFSRWLRKWTMVNCWHINQRESAAMWGLYASSSKAVAVCSTYAKLRDVLDESCHVGVVRYIDFDKDAFPADDFFWPFVHKRTSFEHEKEVRAVTHDLPHNADGLDLTAEPTDDGCWKAVGLSALITQVYVAPGCRPWFADLVKKVTERYSLDKPVEQSSLDSAPFL
ncbi:MAG: DUF2971 domain-containing protein [Verrucomicrobia bacterium]|nr:DUF2971 domain-containing protein [Verrucomicrobiota bacterium]